VIFELQFSDEQAVLDELVKELKAVQGVGSVSLLAPQLALPV
jgi:translation elongation factor EF-1beta